MKEVSDGSNEFMVEIINAYFEQIPEMLQNLSLYLNEKRWTELKDIAHKMQTTVSFLGLRSIKEDIENIEKYAGEKKNLDLLPNMVEKVIMVCSESINELKSEIIKYK